MWWQLIWTHSMAGRPGYWPTVHSVVRHVGRKGRGASQRCGSWPGEAVTDLAWTNEDWSVSVLSTEGKDGMLSFSRQPGKSTSSSGASLKNHPDHANQGTAGLKLGPFYLKFWSTWRKLFRKGLPLAHILRSCCFSGLESSPSLHVTQISY